MIIKKDKQIEQANEHDNYDVAISAIGPITIIVIKSANLKIKQQHDKLQSNIQE